MEVIEELTDKQGTHVEDVVQRALNDAGLLKLVLEGLTSTNEAYRYNCSKVISRLSERYPERLYPEWKRFEALLKSKNSFHRAIAVYTIARLTRVDSGEKFAKIFRRYFDLLDDISLMVARYVAQSAGIIAKSKPALANKITTELLDVQNTHFDQIRKDLIAGDALRSFEQYFEKSHQKEKIVSLARQLSRSKSPSAKKIARQFLKNPQLERKDKLSLGN